MSRSAEDYDLPDVERDFFISEDAPSELQDFVAELLGYLYSPDRGGKIDEYGMWDMGHCWLLAQALHEWIGPRSSLKWVVGRDLRKVDRGLPVLPQHVVVQVGEFYIDGNGLFIKDELIEWFKRDDFIQVSLKPFDPVDAESYSIHCSQRDKRLILRDLDLEFGNGEMVADVAGV